MRSQEILPPNKRLSQVQKAALGGFPPVRGEAFASGVQAEMLLKYHEALLAAEIELNEYRNDSITNNNYSALSDGDL